GDAGVVIATLDELADLLVFDQQLRKVLLAGIPLAEPVDHDAGAEARWPNLLSHSHSFPRCARAAQGTYSSLFLAALGRLVFQEIGQGNVDVSITALDRI